MPNQTVWEELGAETKEVLSATFMLAANSVMMADHTVEKAEIDAMVASLDSTSKSEDSAVVREAASWLIRNYTHMAIKLEASAAESYSKHLDEAKGVVAGLSEADQTVLSIAIRELCLAVGNAAGDAEQMMSPEEVAMASTVMSAMGLEWNPATT